MYPMDRRVSPVPRNQVVEILTRPRQLGLVILHALAPAPQVQEHSRDWGLDSPKDDGDLSLDSGVIALRLEAPRYHLEASFLQSPGNGGERVLAGDVQKKNTQEIKRQDHASGAQGSGSEIFHLRGDSPASAAKVITTNTLHSRPSTATSRSSQSMPAGNKDYHRSPSPPSQDSFGGPVSQDPVARYIASTKQFDVPLSELGETATQEVIHSPVDPEITLPDASEHKEFLEVAMREYEAQRANRLASSRRPNILVAATPNTSGESSSIPQHNGGDFFFQNVDTEFAGQQSRFEFNGSSSFDKMLDRGLADVSDPTPEPTQGNKPDAYVDVEDPTIDDTLTTPPRSSRQCSPLPSMDWIAPAPSATVASSNPRSLLRMVHPGNQYRIAKMRNLAGKVEPPSCVTAGAETQPCSAEEAQPCHDSEPTHSNTILPTQLMSRQSRMAGARSFGHQSRRGGEESEDALDIIPDSEPLRAGSSVRSPSHPGVATETSFKRPFRPLSPMSEHGSGDLVPDSLEVEESEAEVPLAVEMASRNVGGSVAPTDVDVHVRKTTASSTLAAKLPIPSEKQPPRPTSSSKRRNSRPKPSKTDTTGVPTSLPEEDLKDPVFYFRQPHTTTSNVLPSKKQGGSETLEPSRAKHAVGGKRSHRSDTESSEGSARQLTEDKGVVHRRAQKEEEEETDSAYDGQDVDSPPPPPPRPDTSRKRRRTEDTKTMTSTRKKTSETPAVTTRSAKRLRSAVSSFRGLATEQATQVFALWKQDGHYYSGVIYSRGLKNKYLVRFDDRTEDEVELKNMRRRELLVGDRVILIQDNVKAVVRDLSHADSHGSFILEADNGKAAIIHDARFGDIRIANRTIQSQWKDRKLVADDIITVVRPKPLIDTSPSKQSIISTTSGQVQRELVKTGFVVTINPKNEAPIQMKDEAMRAIRQHGGLVIEDWSSVFTMEGRHSQSNKRWSATPQDFRWKSEMNLDRVFLLSDDAHQKPKFLLALALGIPCLSFEWLTKGGRFSSDWQPFLLPAGYSDVLGARISQLIDLDWGNCTEHLTDIMDNEVPIKLFSQKTVLCVGVELVPLPPNRTRKNNGEEASRYVPWIILCMGAAKVEAVADTKQVSLAHMRSFDYIVVRERSVLGSLELDKNVVVGDVNWVKECLVSSRLSLPRLD